MPRKIVNPNPAGYVGNAKGFESQAHKTATEKHALIEGSKEARLVGRVTQVLRLLQRSEQTLKSIPRPNTQEKALIEDLARMLDYVELGI